MSRIVVAGHSSVDLPFSPVHPDVFHSDTLFVEKVDLLTGGDALNVSAGLRRLGAAPCFVTAVGDDWSGKILTGCIDRLGLGTSGVLVKQGAVTIVTAILIEQEGERHFITSGNACRRITREDVLPFIADDTRFLHIGSFMSLDSLEDENMGLLFGEARRRGVHTSFDVTADRSNRWLDRLTQGLPFTDILFASYDEAVALAGGLRAPEAIADHFRKYGVRRTVIKLGKDGCFATDYTGEPVRLPTYSDAPVADTTGAGDSFVAAFLFGVTGGLPLATCCLLGNVNGTLSVGSLGANTGQGTKEQILAYIREHGALGLDAEREIERIAAVPAEGN